MKIFISMPMRNLSKNEIIKEFNKISKELKTKFEDAEIINSINFDIINPVKSLAFSIDKLADADLVVFVNSWNKARGCKIEHTIASEYNKEIIYL